MCGLAGFSLSPREDVDALALARSLLVAVEPRGPHATGAAWTEADGNVYWHKAPGSAHGYVDVLPMPPTSSTAVLHTRWATQGDPRVNGNNHPFSLPGITGAHNGKVHDDARWFDVLGVERTTETDSEALFALLAHADYASPTEVLRRPDAVGALAWIETDRPLSLHLVRLDERPLACGESFDGSLVFASTQSMLHDACAGHLALRRSWMMLPYSYLRFVSGRPSKVERFTPERRRRRVSTAPGRSAADWLVERQATVSAVGRVDPALRLGDRS